MRVVQVDAGREMRGGQWQALRLARCLNERGIAAPLLAREGSPLHGEAVRAGLETHALSYRALSREAHRADLVHAHDARAHSLCAMVCGARFVVSRRVMFPIGSGWKYGRPRHYLAVSECVKRVLIDGGVPQEKITVVYDGVSVPDLPSSGEMVVIAASDDPRKGAARAVEACREAGCEPLVSYRLEEDLQRAALFVSLSESEGLGSAVLLAMAAGVPVVASRVGGLPEVIEQGVNGLLVDDGAASAIRALMEDPARRREMGLRARGTVAARFTVERMVSGTIDVYRSVL
jgi:glycosyltransferase involved in cell wall biosynthesis